VLIIGFSLGAAVSTLIANRFVKLYPQIKEKMYLFCFGSPRVGNEKFVNYTNNLLTPQRIFRVIYGKDPVPMVPPAVFGFLHIGNGPYFFSDLKTFKKLPQADDKKSLVVAIATKNVRITDHLKYKEL